MQKMIFAAMGLSAALANAALAQHPVSDDDKIADALTGGPAFITKDAAIGDWPAKHGDPFRILRKGASSWTCLPGPRQLPHDEPGCYDPVYMQWMADNLAGKTPTIKSIGISYMSMGAWVPNQAGMHHGETDHTFHVGPHVMMVTPGNVGLDGFSRDGSTGGAYVRPFPTNPSQLYLVVPIQQWPEQ